MKENRRRTARNISDQHIMEKAMAYYDSSDSYKASLYECRITLFILYFWIGMFYRIYMHLLPMPLQEMINVNYRRYEISVPKNRYLPALEIGLGVGWWKSLSEVAPFVRIAFFICLD